MRARARRCNCMRIARLQHVQYAYVLAIARSCTRYNYVCIQLQRSLACTCARTCTMAWVHLSQSDHSPQIQESSNYMKPTRTLQRPVQNHSCCPPLIHYTRNMQVLKQRTDADRYSFAQNNEELACGSGHLWLQMSDAPQTAVSSYGTRSPNSE